MIDKQKTGLDTLVNQQYGKSFGKTLTGSASLTASRVVAGIIVEALPFTFTAVPVPRDGVDIPTDADQTISKTYSASIFQVPLYIDYLPNMNTVVQTEGTAYYQFA